MQWQQLGERTAEYLDTLREILFALSASDAWFAGFLLLILILTWLALRGVRLWYWKQERILESLQRMEELLERNLEMNGRILARLQRQQRDVPERRDPIRASWQGPPPPRTDGNATGENGHEKN